MSVWVWIGIGYGLLLGGVVVAAVVVEVYDHLEERRARRAHLEQLERYANGARR